MHREPQELRHVLQHAAKTIFGKGSGEIKNLGAVLVLGGWALTFVPVGRTNAPKQKEPNS